MKIFIALFSLLLLAALTGAKPSKQNQPTVYFFTGTHCPLAQRYASRMATIAEQLKSKGVNCVLVNANADESEAEFATWAQKNKIGFTRLKDDGTLAKRLGASVTPEAALVDAAGVVRYLGRIDDNLEAKNVARQDVMLAVASILGGQPVKQPRIVATGCRISFSASPKVIAPASPITYEQNVKPILARNCVTCHQPGEVAPFSLQTYAEARDWSKLIRSYTKDRLMPPWKAVSGHGDFHDARYLSQKELDTLAAWDASGAPQGKVVNSVPVAAVRPAGSWPLGKPDQLLRLKQGYQLSAEGNDVYRNFLLPLDTTTDRYITAFDFKPGNRRIVHHVILYAVSDPDSIKEITELNGKDWQEGWDGNGSPSDSNPMVAGWAPGSDARKLPPGVAFKIPKGARLVAEVHYHKSGKPETDQTQVAVYETSTPTQNPINTYAVGETSFVLKPDVAKQKITAELEVPEDMSLWTAAPHMHQLGKKMRVWATLPDGSQKKLIKIDNWEFKWQGFYHYKEPVFLPKGSKIELEAEYDNTKNNPDQPSLPPKEVTYGEQTTDEMCFFFFNFSLGKLKK
jgi:mono/diheme cytochrome c family protein